MATPQDPSYHKVTITQLRDKFAHENWANRLDGWVRTQADGGWWDPDPTGQRMHLLNVTYADGDGHTRVIQELYIPEVGDTITKVTLLRDDAGAVFYVP